MHVLKLLCCYAPRVLGPVFWDDNPN